MISAIRSMASFCEPSDFSISFAIFSRTFFCAAAGSSRSSSLMRLRITSSVSTALPREESFSRSSERVMRPCTSLSISSAFSGVRSSWSSLGAGLSCDRPSARIAAASHVTIALLLVFGQPLHVLLEHLLVLGREVVDGALAGHHRLPDAGGQVAPPSGPVAAGAELVDRLPVAVRIVRLVRRIRRLIGLLGLGFLLLTRLGLAGLGLPLALGRLHPADHFAHLVRALALGLLRLAHQLLDLLQDLLLGLRRILLRVLLEELVDLLQQLLLGLERLAVRGVVQELLGRLHERADLLEHLHRLVDGHLRVLLRRSGRSRRLVLTEGQTRREHQCRQHATHPSALSSR